MLTFGGMNLRAATRDDRQVFARYAYRNETIVESMRQNLNSRWMLEVVPALMAQRTR
ncbi:MAG: hypothetical protein HYZ00_13400 [Candidatus Hydrogenedentes bacterium]|nr:hypothetical protein [Candidatus Hydrogenedentota bacterium]